EVGARLLEADRVHVGDVVADDVDGLGLGRDARSAGVKRTEDGHVVFPWLRGGGLPNQPMLWTSPSITRAAPTMSSGYPCSYETDETTPWTSVETVSGCPEASVAEY